MMTGDIRPWGQDLDRDLSGLTGDLSLILVGPGPVEFHGPAPVSQQQERIAAARARYGQNFLFHLFSREAEYRFDHGQGQALLVTPDGPYTLVEKDYYLVADARRARGIASLAGAAPTGRMKVREFVRDGLTVELKLEELI